MSWPWDIPKNWQWTEMGEVSAVVGGGTPDTRDPDYFGGDIAWLTPADLSGYTAKHVSRGARNITKAGYENSGAQIMPAGSVLFRSRAPIGYVAIATGPICTNQGFKSFVLELGLRPDFIYYYLRYAKPLISKLASGTTFLEISGKNAARISVPVAPSTEQERIADALDELFSDLDAGMFLLERAREKLKLYRASVLKAAVEGELTAEWRKQHPHAEPASELLKRILAERRRRWEEDQLRKFKEKGQEPPKNWKAKYIEPKAPTIDKLPVLPEHWHWASLDQLFRVERGRFSVRPRNDPRYYGGDVAFVQIGELPREGGLIRTFSQTLNDAGLSVSKKFPAGTVLIAIVGATIGNSGVLAFDSCCPDSLVALQSTSSALLRFAELFLRTKKLALRAAASASGGQPNINLELLQPLAIPLAPAEEIEAIVDAAEDQLSIFDHLEADLEAKLKSAESLRQAILRHAFTGKLVPQDPKDGPASELLRRIAAEREARAREAAAAKRATKKTNGTQRSRPVKQEAL